MNRIVDVVNFNADASCLASDIWLSMLQGGADSQLVQWLHLYLEHEKKVTLGFTGSTVADISVRNPDAIDLINSRPDIFEIILRPFAHDIALLRLKSGFAANIESGKRVIMQEFHQITPWFLPPEFMLTNEQLAYLIQQSFAGVFINPSRFSAETRKRILSHPFQVRGLFGAECACIPFCGELTALYLHALQQYDNALWNQAISCKETEDVFSWRDGESPFLLPDGLARESYWLSHEIESVERKHLRELSLSFLRGDQSNDSFYRSYPVHSFTAWMKEFRMLGFVNRMAGIERKLDVMTPEQFALWLAVINSDILSAVEKRSPIVQLADSPGDNSHYEYVIQRSERGFEGEEYLVLLEESFAIGTVPDYVSTSTAPHILKLRGRMEYLLNLGASSSMHLEPKNIL